MLRFPECMERAFVMSCVRYWIVLYSIIPLTGDKRQNCILSSELTPPKATELLKKVEDT